MNLFGFGCVWSGLVGFGWIWLGLVGFGWVWLGLVRFSQVWLGLVGFGFNVHFDLFFQTCFSNYLMSDITTGVAFLRTCGPNKY